MPVVKAAGKMASKNRKKSLPMGPSSPSSPVDSSMPGMSSRYDDGLSKSLRPEMRPEGVKKSLRPKMRPKMIGNAPGSQGTSGIDPKDNYSPEDYDRLMDSYGGKTQKFRGGGEVRGCKSSQMTGKGFAGSY